MTNGVNRAFVIGNLGADPETRYTQNGTAVANISVATSESWKDKNTGEKREKTEWHRISAFGRLAEIMGEYLSKGSKVYIEGRLQTDKWQDREGNDRYTTKIIARDLQMLDGRNNGNQGGGRAAPQQSQQPSQEDIDDDIPFMHAWLYPVAGTVAALMTSAGSIPGVA